MATLRPSDYRAETAVSEFLDLYFYPKRVRNLVRYTDQAHQFSGIDVQFDFQQRSKMLVDEKAAAHYVNKNLPTFAFEMDFIGQDRQLKKGWFYDPSKKTEYYLLTWIWAKKNKGFTSSDITQLEVVLIQRETLIYQLSQVGLTANAGQRIANIIRTNKQTGVSYKLLARPYYFYFTEHLVERPINLIVRKKKLIEWSLLHEFVKVK